MNIMQSRENVTATQNRYMDSLHETKQHKDEVGTPLRVHIKFRLLTSRNWVINQITCCKWQSIGGSGSSAGGK
jgi:hypothetical protein